MSVRLLIGRSGSGKSTLIRNEMTSMLREEPLGKPMLLLVPEQSSFASEHALLTEAGNGIQGSVRAQVMGFHRLAYLVMQETGGSALVPVTEEGKKMLLYKIIRRRKDELSLFKDSGDQLGFVDRLNTLFTELKQYGNDTRSVPEQLERMNAAGESTPILRGKLKDISLIYEDFERELTLKYIDGEDTLRMLAEQIAESSLVRGADIWMDGYRRFTPHEYKVVEQLMLHASSLTVALTCNRSYESGQLPHELDLFHPSAATYVKLKGMADELMIETQTQLLRPDPLPRFKERPALAYLEANFEHRTGLRNQEQWMRLQQLREQWTEEQPEGIKLYTAANRRAELEGAVREMRRLARDEGARYREMALFVRHIEDYEPWVEPIFKQYEVPVFLDQRRSVLHHPLVELIRASLDIVQRRWRYEDVFRAVKTDLLLPLDGRVSREEMDRLENYVLACGIQGSRWTDGRPWQAVPSLSLELEEQERNRQRDETLDLMELCRDVIVTPLRAFEKRVGKARTALEKCEAVYLLLEDAEIGHKLDAFIHQAEEAGKPEQAKEHRQVWDAVLELLDQIVEMMGDERLDTSLFAGVLETGLAEFRMGLVPPALDQVLVGNTDRTRVSGIQHAFVLGMNEGVMPAVFHEDGVLNEQERTALNERGVELAPDMTRRLLDERFLAYTALTSAGKSLWMSYAVTDEEGKSLLPSELVRHVRHLFPSLDERPLAGYPLPGDAWTTQWEYASHPSEALPQLIAQLRHWRRDGDILSPWWEVYNWYASQQGREKDKLRQLLTSLFYENHAEMQKETSRRLYGSKLRTSVSRMERFVACPFSHFASHGLRLKERQMYRLKAPDIGQLFHAALGEMAINLRKRNVSWGSLSTEECRQEAESTVERLAPRLQGEILMSSKRYGYILRKLKDIVSRASLILGEHARRGSFEPIGLELDFGPGQQLPPLSFRLDNGVVMEIVGRIDRVDVAEGEKGLLLRVIDYKSSQKDLKLHEVYYGLSLQMLTYLDVLLNAAEEWLGETAYPAGTLYFHVHNPMLQSPNGLSAEQARQELLKRFKMKGLLLADRDVVGQMDTALDKGYSSILPVAVKADGSFYSSASVASPEQWDSLLASVRHNIRTIGTRMTEGDVAIEPYRIQQETACTFCSFKPVCQFDDSLDGSGYNQWGKPGKDQIWNLLGHTQEGKGGMDQ
ncbi:helicase-exonuclease AddAB subunit AddB [Paenibacillus polymyxa]|uniref:ATP-dependent helicase/deoxyribonuclease subunit B n=1 Tax=Paenibacillus polymyxa TaxID=1406 RepID=A0AAP4EBD6_PAEPO|nr:helicase-exonuclease AddAB subunit AddB [Paenibacillus polymyxa]MDH2332313.1 helicase-exonuclease AddAB subunit AddB [Paenibacillus polymyxa]